MSAPWSHVPRRIDRIRRHLVGLKMPRALEALDAHVRRLEQGEIARAGSDRHLLGEELTLRENRRIKIALRMARLATIKTLAGFDFSFQPSLDRNRILALAAARLHRPQRGRPLPRPARHRQEPSRHRARRRGGQGRQERLLRHAGRHRSASLAKAEREGRLRERIRFFCRPRAADRRRDRLPAGRPRRRQPVLPARQRPLRARRDDPHLQPRLRRMGRDLRRSRRRHRACSIACSTTPSSSRSRAPAIACAQHAELMPEHVRSKALITPPTSAAASRPRGRPPKNGYSPPRRLSGRTGEFYFGTSGEIYSGIDNALRHARFRAARSIEGPGLGQVELAIDQRMPVAAGISEKHADLAVLDAPCSTAVLARHAGRLVPFFRKPVSSRISTASRSAKVSTT